MIGKLVLVGESPGRASIADRPELALTGATGENLCRIAGWPWLTYLKRTERHNLFYDPQPHWDARLAASRARELELALEGRTIILCGALVARAFGVSGEPNYQWLIHDFDAVNIAKIPHPSGRNRKWNDWRERKAARDFLEHLL